MSTDYAPRNNAIRMEDLFDGRLESYGITEHIKEGSTRIDARCLSDGRNWLWVYGDGFARSMTRYGFGNCPTKIVNAIEEEFQTEVFTEYEPQYWGYETREEWDEAWEKMAEESEAEFYLDLVKYVKGDANNIKPGTVGAMMAEIAKELVAENPDLLDPNSKSDLMELVNKVYSEKHCVAVSLTEEDIRMIELAATHEDDLPLA